MIEAIRSIFNTKKEPLTEENKLIRDYNATRKGSGHKTFCHAPSVNMYFTQDGKVKVCCNNFYYVIGTYPQQNISQIWNSEAAETLRGNMRKYDLSAGCGVCEYDFKGRNFNQVRARHFDSIVPSLKYPRMMEFLLTNTCNLECVMCRGENSSLIRKNREKLPPIPSAYDKEFLNQLEEFIPHLVETRFSGSGEAFSIDLYYEIWEKIIELNPKCLIVVQTNGTILSGRAKDMLERGNFEIGVSIDSLQKETYESIRVNARLDKVLANIHYFQEYSERKKKRFTLSACVMRQNWHEIPAFINFCNDLNAVATLHKVWWPRESALYNLSEPELTKIHAQLAAYIPSANGHLEEHNKQNYLYFVSVIKDWLSAAPLIQKEKILAAQMPETELLPYFKGKLSQCILESDMPENERADSLQLCIDKLEQVFTLCNEKLTPEMILRWIAYLPAHEVLNGFKMESAEFIFLEAQRELV